MYKQDLNTDDVSEIITKEKPEIVYYLAGPINLRRNILDPLFLQETNFFSRTEKILHGCAKNNVKKIIFISSGGSIYENANIIPTPENYSVHPVSMYGLANLLIEKYI